jgi:branched-chain amino acid aminotransferase
VPGFVPDRPGLLGVPRGHLRLVPPVAGGPRVRQGGPGQVERFAAAAGVAVDGGEHPDRLRLAAPVADLPVQDERPDEVVDSLGRHDEPMRQTFDPRNADIVYWANGVLRHRDEPGLSPFDSVVQGGDAVWEGLRLYEGRIFGLHEHLDRLYRSARVLGFARVPDRDAIVAAIRETLAANGMRDGVHVRLTLTRGVKITSGMDPRLNESGCTLVVLAEHKAPVYDTTGLRLVTASIRRPAPDVLDPKIHHNNLLNSILAKAQANLAGVDDAIMLDDRGLVAETNATNLFTVVGRAVSTPFAYACPEGITRATVLALAPTFGVPAGERDLSLTDFCTADEVFCTGTMGEIAGVVEIDGRPIGGGAVGPVTKLLADRYRAHAKAHGVPVL